MTSYPGFRAFALTVVAILATTMAVADPGTAFTYQAQIEDGGTPVTGTISGRYALFDAETGGSQVGSTLTPSDVIITDGLLIQELDFGPGIFDGTELFLQVEIDTDGGADSFVLLGDRTKVAPTPYSIYAENAGTALNVTNDAVDDADADPLNEVNTSLTLTSATLELTDAGGTLTADLSSLSGGGSGSGDGHSLNAVDGDPVDAVFVNEEGFVGVGTNDPEVRLHVAGDKIFNGPIAITGRGSALFSVPTSVAVQGNFLYVTGSNGLGIFDVSNPDGTRPLLDADATGLSPAPQSVAVHGNFAYVVDPINDILAIFDVSDPTNIVPRDTDGTGLSSPQSVAVEGDFAYIADSDNGLAIFEISDPTNIIPRDTDGTGLSSPQFVAVEGDFAYIADSDNGLAVFEISDPDNIVPRDIEGTGLSQSVSVAVQGDFAYVGNNGSGLATFDVSDPDNILPLDTNDTDVFGVSSIAVQGDFAFVASALLGELTVFDVSDPNNIAPVANEGVGLPAVDMAVQLNIPYIADDAGAVGIWELGPATNLVSLVSDGLVGIGTTTPVSELEVNGTVTATAFVGDGSALTGITDSVDDADADPANEVNTSLTLTSTTLELTDSGGTLTADLSTLAGSTFGDGHSLDAVDGDPVDAVFVNEEGFAGIGTNTPLAGLHVATGSEQLLQLGVAKDGDGTFTELNGAFGVFVSGTTAYVASRDDGSLTIIDVSDPANPAQLGVARDGDGTFTELNSAVDVFVSGTTAYVAAAFDSSLTIIDVSDPANPAQLGVAKNGDGTFTDLGGAGSVFVSGTTAYVASRSDSSLTIIDVSDPANPAQLGVAKDGDGTFTELNGAQGVFVSGTTAYVASFTDDSLTIIDVSDPANPAQLGVAKDGDGTFTELTDARSVFVSGTTAYVTSPFDNSLTIIDVSDPANPAQLGVAKDGDGTFTELFEARGVFVSGTTAYVASTRDDSLTIIDVNITSAELIVEGDSLISGGTGPVSLTLEADTNNSGESNQPSLLMTQDGGAVQASLGFFATRNDFEIATEGTVPSDILLSPGSAFVGVNNTSPAFPLEVGTDTTNGNGAHVTADGMWTNGSSRNFKSNFRDLDPVSVLETLTQLPIRKWSYDGNPEQDHIGPTAEDFHEAFGLGHSDRYIGTVDADGVALIAIQGLNRKLEEKDREIRELKKENDAMKERLVRLETLMARPGTSATD